MHGDYENENMGFCSLKDVNFQLQNDLWSLHIGLFEREVCDVARFYG